MFGLPVSRTPCRSTLPPTTTSSCGASALQGSSTSLSRVKDSRTSSPRWTVRGDRRDLRERRSWPEPRGTKGVIDCLPRPDLRRSVRLVHAGIQRRCRRRAVLVQRHHLRGSVSRSARLRQGSLLTLSLSRSGGQKPRSAAWFSTRGGREWVCGSRSSRLARRERCRLVGQPLRVLTSSQRRSAVNAHVARERGLSGGRGGIPESPHEGATRAHEGLAAGASPSRPPRLVEAPHEHPATQVSPAQVPGLPSRTGSRV